MDADASAPRDDAGGSQHGGVNAAEVGTGQTDQVNSNLNGAVQGNCSRSISTNFNQAIQTLASGDISEALKEVLVTLVDNITQAYDNKILALESEVKNLSESLRQARDEISDLSTRVPYKPVEVNVMELNEFIQSDTKAQRLLYSAAAASSSATAADASASHEADYYSAPKSKRRKLNDDNNQVEHDGKEERNNGDNDGGDGSSDSYDDESSQKRSLRQSYINRSSRTWAAKAKSAKSSKAPRRFMFDQEQFKILKEWLLEHEKNPYPTETDRTVLPRQLGAPWRKIHTWIINARRRILPKLIQERDSKLGITTKPNPDAAPRRSSRRRDTLDYQRLAGKVTRNGKEEQGENERDDDDNEEENDGDGDSGDDNSDNEFVSTEQQDDVYNQLDRSTSERHSNTNNYEDDELSELQL